MKFQCSVEIHHPLDRVVGLFSDPSSISKYQPTFLPREGVSGEPGQEGTVSRLYFQNGKKEIELTETVLSNQLPNEYLAQVHHEHMNNTLHNGLTAIN